MFMIAPRTRDERRHMPTIDAAIIGRAKMNRNMIIRGAAIVLLMIGSAIGKQSVEAILAVGIVAFVGVHRYTGSPGSTRDVSQPMIILGWRARARWTHNKEQWCGQCQDATMWAFSRLR